jgi:hypothetical protein
MGIGSFQEQRWRAQDADASGAGVLAERDISRISSAEESFAPLESNEVEAVKN